MRLRRGRRGTGMISNARAADPRRGVTTAPLRPPDGGCFGYTAFVIGAFAGLIAGWECSLSKETAFVERAIRQAAALRARQGHPLGNDAIHHSDAGKAIPPHNCRTRWSSGPRMSG